MLSIMIIDDEDPIRRGLEKMIGKLSEEYLVVGSFYERLRGFAGTGPVDAGPGHHRYQNALYERAAIHRGIKSPPAGRAVSDPERL